MKIIFLWLSTTGKNKKLPSDRITSKLCLFLSMFLDFLFGTSQSKLYPCFFPKIRSAGEMDIAGNILLFKTVLDKELISTFLSKEDD